MMKSPKYTVHCLNTRVLKQTAVTQPLTARGIQEFLTPIYRRNQAIGGNNFAAWMNVGWTLIYRNNAGILLVYYAVPVIESDKEPDF